MMMMMMMTTKYRIKHCVICLCQSAVVVVVVLLIIVWWWCDVNDHHHMYSVLWRIYSRSFSYQGRVIAPTLFGIFSSLLLSNPFDSSTDGVYLHTSIEGKLVNLARLCAKTKAKTVFASEMLFSDNPYRGNIAEAHQQIRQHMWNLWPRNQSQENQCECLGCQPSPWNQNRRPHSRGSRQIHLPRFHRLHEHEQDSEISRRATGTMSKLTKRARENKCLIERTKMHMYEACLLSKLFHGSETWTTYTRQKQRLNTFYLRCLRRILGVKWQDHITNSEMLSRAETPSMYSILSQRRLRWLGHTHRMDDGRIPNEDLYWQLTTGVRQVERPALRSKDACKTWPQSMRNSSKQLRRCRVSSCLLETVKERGNSESWLKTSPERWREARSPQKQLHSARPPPASSAPCAVGTASYIGRHSHTSSNSNTTDWQECTSFVSRDFVWQ